LNTDADQHKPPATDRGGPSAVDIQREADLMATFSHLPRSAAISADERVALAYQEGYDPLAVELAFESPAATYVDKLRLLVFALAAAALVVFFFPTERFFKPAARELGIMTIGGPTTAGGLKASAASNAPWFNVLLEIDRLYFGEGKLSQAIRLAESTLEKLPPEKWELWKKVHYRYWELLAAAGRIRTLRTASRAYLKIWPEDAFANYYDARAFLTAANRVQSYSAKRKQEDRQTAPAIIQRIDSACYALDAQRKHADSKEKQAALTELYRKLRLEQAKLLVFIWKLGGYQEDQHPDTAYRDQALGICDSADLSDMQAAKELKINIYTHILDRWYWFEGQQVIEGKKLRRKALEQEIASLRKALRRVEKR